MDESANELRVSVILCTYDSGDYGHFRDAAESVLKQTYEHIELVVVVDGSEELYDRVNSEFGSREDTLVRGNDRNVGLLTSRNRGVEIATGEVVAFIDDDAIADARWVEELVEVYRARDVLAVGGRMVPKWISGRPGFLPEEFYWLIGVTHRGFPEGSGWVRNTFGSNLSFRRRIFLELGGFDAEIGGRKGDQNLQGGETELCARLHREYGSNVWYVPEAIVAHKVFEYRTDLTWLIERAFWQGYSKRVMATLVSGGSKAEGEFLHQLLTDFLPSRIGGLIGRPRLQRLSQLGVLLILSASVGLGYLYGILRYRK